MTPPAKLRGRFPPWSLAAVAVFVASPLLGIASGVVDNAMHPLEERDSGVFWVIYLVAWLGFVAGMILASVGMSRGERPRWLSYIAFCLNATPVFLPVGLGLARYYWVGVF